MTLRVALAVLVVALGAGCAASRPAGRPMSITPTEDGAIVEVELDEYVIRMPDIVPPGRIIFRVTNTGSHRHTISIQGQGEDAVDTRLSPDLEGGQSVDWTLELKPGTYRVWCPVGPHAALGMRMTLTVKPQP